MSSTCNYCKANGHRIYRVESDGQRTLTCPVLIEKEKKRPNVEEEFPALPGSKTLASAGTVAIVKAIACAEQEKKQREWQKRQDDRENRQRIWQQKMEAKEKEMGLILYNKYGPTWFLRVRGNIGEDSDYASRLRCEHEEKQRRRDEEYERRQAEFDAEYDAKKKGREAKRALMTREEARKDERDEEDELEDDWYGSWIQHDHQYYLHLLASEREKKHYEAMGWPWPPAL